MATPAAWLEERGHASRWRSRMVRGLLIGIAALFLGVILLLPLVTVFVEAFDRGIGFYREALVDPDALAAMRLTLLVTALVVPLNTLFGIAAAYAIARFSFRGKSVLTTLIDLPFAVSPVISGLAYVLVFGASGWFGPWLEERDIEVLSRTLQTRMNLEMALAEPVLRLAETLRPADCCLVPERRQELTTEGGLDVAADLGRVREAAARLAAAGIRVAPFIDPDPVQVDACAAAGVRTIELHTGRYAEAPDAAGQARELERLRQAARHAARLGFEVHAGHGLHYHNVQPVAALAEISELNIGHAIVARAVFDGLAAAVAEMKRLMVSARPA